MITARRSDWDPFVMVVALLEQQLAASLDGYSPRHRTFSPLRFSQLGFKAVDLGPIAKRTYHSACCAALHPETARNSKLSDEEGGRCMWHRQHVCHRQLEPHRRVILVILAPPSASAPLDGWRLSHMVVSVAASPTIE